MNARSLVVTMLCLALALPALAQEPEFGDLYNTETSTYTRDSVYRKVEIDTENFDAAMFEARELLDGTAADFRSIYLSTESLYRELEGNVALGHWTKARFAASKTRAAALRAKAAKLAGLMERLNSFFATLDVKDREGFAALEGRHAKVVALVTEYNELCAWASTFNLDFDTAEWFDEKDMIVLPRDGNPQLAFPVLPLRRESGAVAETLRENVEGRSGAPLVRRSDTVVVATHKEFRAADHEEVKAVLDSASELAGLADEMRSSILSLADDTADRRLSFQKALTVFESQVKPLAVDFALTMLRLKGLRNAAWALLDGSDLMEGDQNTQAGWRELSTRFEDLARWGDGTVLRWNPTPLDQRAFVIFFRTNFRITNLFHGSGEVDVATGRTTVEQAVQPLTGDAISVDDAFRLVKSVTGSSRRRDMCLRVIPRTRGLTAQGLSNLVSWIGNDSYEADVMSFGLQYIGR